MHGAELDLKSVYRWLALPPDELLKGCDRDRFQASGPGGQKRNRVYSGVRLIHEESGLTAEASAHRESLRNVEDALHRLRLELALMAVPSASKTIEPSASQGETSRLADPSELRSSFPGPAFRPDCSAAHADFPGFALRALHQLAWNRGQGAAAAAGLGCSVSALVRFLKADKAVWAKARSIREAHGMHPFK